jgi:hypothetical protein
MALVSEWRDMLVDLAPFIQGEIPHLQVPDVVFSKYQIFLDAVKAQSFRRADDTIQGGTYTYSNKNTYDFGDLVIDRMPTIGFPETGSGSNYRCLWSTPSASRVKFSRADVAGVSILGQTMSSLESSEVIARMTEAANPEMVRILNAMGADKAVAPFISNGAMSGSLIPNIVRMYVSKMPDGTDPWAGYYYSKAVVAFGVLRANPSAMREWIVPKALIV